MSTTSNIIQLYSDGKQVNKIYPRTTTDAVVDDKGNKLTDLLENIDIAAGYVSEAELNEILSTYATTDYVDSIGSGSVVIDADGRKILNENIVPVNRPNFTEANATYVYKIETDSPQTMINADPSNYFGTGHSSDAPSETNKTVIDEKPMAIINTTNNIIYFKYRYRSSQYGTTPIYFSQCHDTYAETYSLTTGKVFCTRNVGILQFVQWNGSEFTTGTPEEVEINLLTQAAISGGGAYTIKDEFDLNGATIKPLKGTILYFAGGKIKNGVIDCSNGVIISAGHEEIFENVKVYNNRIQILHDYWFDDIWACWNVAMNDHVSLSRDYTLDYRYMGQLNWKNLSGGNNRYTATSEKWCDLTHIIGNGHTITIDTTGESENVGFLSAMYLHIEDLNVYCTNPLIKSLAYCFEGHHLIAHNLKYVGYPRLYPNWNQNKTKDTYFELKDCHIECQSFINEYNFRQILIENSVIRYYNTVGVVYAESGSSDDDDIVGGNRQYGNLFSCGPWVSTNESDIKDCWVDIKNSFIGGGWEYVMVKDGNKQIVTRTAKTRSGKTYTQHIGYDRMTFTNCEFEDFVLGTYNSQENYVGNTTVEFNNCTFNCCKSRWGWNKIDTVTFRNCVLKGYGRSVAYNSGSPFSFTGANDVTYIACTFTKEPYKTITASVESTVTQGTTLKSNYINTITTTDDDGVETTTYKWASGQQCQFVAISPGVTYKISSYSTASTQYAFLTTSTITVGSTPSWADGVYELTTLEAGNTDMVVAPDNANYLYTIYSESGEVRNPESIKYTSGAYGFAGNDFKWINIRTDHIDIKLNLYGNRIIVNPNSTLFPIVINKKYNSAGSRSQDEIKNSLDIYGNEFVYTKQSNKRIPLKDAMAYVNNVSNILPINNTTIFSTTCEFDFYNLNTEYCTSDFTISWRTGFTNKGYSTYYPGGSVTGYFNSKTRKFAFFKENGFPYVDFKTSGQKSNIYGATLLSRYKSMAKKGDSIWFDADVSSTSHYDKQLIYDGYTWMSPAMDDYRFETHGTTDNENTTDFRRFATKIGAMYFDDGNGKPVFLKTLGTCAKMSFTITSTTYTANGTFYIQFNGPWTAIKMPAAGVLTTTEQIASYIVDYFNSANHGGANTQNYSMSSSGSTVTITYDVRLPLGASCTKRVSDGKPNVTGSSTALTVITISEISFVEGSRSVWVDATGTVVS